CHVQWRYSIFWKKEFPWNSRAADRSPARRFSFQYLNPEFLLLYFVKPSVEISNNEFVEGHFVVNDFLELFTKRVELYFVSSRLRGVAIDGRDGHYVRMSQAWIGKARRQDLKRIDEMDDR
ncbi:unnamed protein product, partial [Haemonchus placei]|uniref:Peptidase_M3 domain-containing protein n=1 Tax=Haemonchus placei TaxID=6290 RepID=A0A0N4XBJ4_HAEPC